MGRGRQQARRQRIGRHGAGEAQVIEHPLPVMRLAVEPALLQAFGRIEAPAVVDDGERGLLVLTECSLVLPAETSQGVG